MTPAAPYFWGFQLVTILRQYLKTILLKANRPKKRVFMQGKAKGFSLFFDQKSLRKKKATFADRMDTKKKTGCGGGFACAL